MNHLLGGHTSPNRQILVNASESDLSVMVGGGGPVGGAEGSERTSTGSEEGTDDLVHFQLPHHHLHSRLDTIDLTDDITNNNLRHNLQATNPSQSTTSTAHNLLHNNNLMTPSTSTQLLTGGRPLTPSGDIEHDIRTESSLSGATDLLGSRDLNGGRRGSGSEISIVGLKRRVGLLSGTALIVGTMIGSGIFVSPKGVLQRSGSVGLSLLIWAGSGLISLCGALCYAELGTLISKSGAEYSYMLESFGGLLAFLFSWISVFILKPAMLSIICLTLAEYIVSPLLGGGLSAGNCPSADVIVKLITILAIVLITYLNCYSVDLATGTQNLFTAAKLAAVAIIVLVGAWKLVVQGETQYISSGFEGSKWDVTEIATAFYFGLWAYDGWNNLNYVTEELINPYENLPKAIIYGIPMVTICYVLVNISYMTVMSTQDILSSDAVAVTWADRVLGWAAIIMPLSVALSSFGAGNGSCFTSGRLSFAAAREGHLVDVLAYIDMHRYTPSPALIFNAFLSIIYVALGNIESLIDFFSFTAWLFYGLTMLALIVLRFKYPYREMPRPYRVNLAIPICMFAVCMYLVIAPIVSDPQIEYLYATLYIASGLLFYIPFVVKGYRVSLIDKITWLTQVCLNVVPCDYGPNDEPAVPDLHSDMKIEPIVSKMMMNKMATGGCGSAAGSVTGSTGSLAGNSSRGNNNQFQRINSSGRLQ